MVATICMDQISQNIKLLLHHKQQGFESPTSIDQGGTDDFLIGIELATTGQVVVVVVALDNQTLTNIGEKRKLFVYKRAYQDTC